MSNYKKYYSKNKKYEEEDNYKLLASASFFITFMI